MPSAAQVIASAAHYYESGQSIPPGYCLKIVRTIAGIGSRAATAAQAYHQASNVHQGDTNAPAGAFYYWTGGSHGAGHIAISAGHGYIYTTDYPQKGKVGLVKLSTLNNAWGNLHFQGWADNVNGGRVKGLGNLAPAKDLAANMPKAAKAAAASKAARASASANAGNKNLISKSDLAAGLANAGYSQALINAYPELKKKFTEAVQKGWDTDRFQGEIKNTKWYRSRSQYHRQYDTLKKNDPKTFSHNLSETESSLRSQAATMGVQISDDRLAAMAQSVYRNGLSAPGSDPGVIQRLLAGEFEFQKATKKTVTTPGTTTTTTTPGSNKSEFDQLVKSIAKQETGGHQNPYTTTGTRTGEGHIALGKYQVMDNYLGEFSRRYLGRTMTTAQFLADPAAQDKLARARLSELYKRGGAAYAAAAWYAGEGGAKAYKKGGNPKPGKGTVGPDTVTYVKGVLSRIHKSATSTSSTSSTQHTTTTYSTPTSLTGDAGQYMDQVRDLAHSYGVKISDKTLGQNIQDILAGKNDIEGLTSYYRAQAASLYPQFSEQLKTGSTLSDIAAPYVQQMAQTLEMDDAGLDWSNPVIQRGMSQKDANGKPTAMPLWQFDTYLKNDPRWKATNNARESLLTAGRSVLQDMGLVS